MGSVSRSKSFNSPSILFTRPIKYTHPHPPASLSRSCSRGNKYGYLGQHMGPPPSGNHSSALGTVKVNPNKTTATIAGLQTGLKGAIKLIQDQITRNNTELQGQQGRIYDLEKNAKSLTLQLKTLEYQLSRLDSLEEEYSLQQRLREGVRSMAYAYTLSSGHHQKLALANVKAGFRECTESLSVLEGQLQEFLGALHLTMKGIQGFARLCPGDVYEIVVKHGNQKWKTRTKVTKDGGQEWDYPEAKVIPILGQDLYIKAAEVKTLGKQVLLGNKFCEICHLFSAHPQLMTVNLNPSGSLKLNLMVEWDPLAQFYNGHGTGSVINVASGCETYGESPLRKRRMLISPIGSLTTTNGSRRLFSEFDSPSSCSGDSSGVGSAPTSLGEELKETLAKLSSILNDEIQGQYPELEVMEVNVAALRRLTFQEWPEFSSRGRNSRAGANGGGKGSSRSSRFTASNSSLNIASALEAFDFLDSEVSSPQMEERANSFGDAATSSQSNTAHSSLRLFSVEEESIKLTPTTKNTITSDSGISSLTSNSSRSPSPGEGGAGNRNCCWVTGSEQLDLVLHCHVILCLKLVNNLGSFGPLKWKEKNALTKLHQQGIILGNILNRLRDKEMERQLFELEGMPFIQNLWTEITGSGTTLITTADQVAFGLEGEIRKFLLLEDKEHVESAPHLAKSLVLQMLDEGIAGMDVDVDAGALFQLQRHHPLTLFQFINYLKPYQNSFPRLVNDIAEEEFLAQKLSSARSPDQVDLVLSELDGGVPPTPVFLPLIRLLTHQNVTVRSAVSNYLLAVAETRRREILENCLELLEYDQGFHRAASLSVLELIGPYEVMDQVAYLAQTDPDLKVREGAKRILLRHKEGGRMHAQLTLHSHGFQGLLTN